MISHIFFNIHCDPIIGAAPICGPHPGNEVNEVDAQPGRSSASDPHGFFEGYHHMDLRVQAAKIEI